MKAIIKMTAIAFFTTLAMFCTSCSKDENDGGNNELVGTTWYGAPEFSGEDYDMYLNLTISFLTSTTGTYIQGINGEVKTWSFTYSYKGGTGTVSGAPFKKFTISGQVLSFDPGITYGGYPVGDLTINKQ